MTGGTVILGAPGAGKGTQAQRVCGTLGLVHLSTGDLLRGAVAAGTPAGREAKSFMEAGKLVPDDVVFGVLFERLQPADGPAVEGFMLDGFPRNRAQAEELDRRLEAAGQSLDAVVDVAVPDSRIVERITGRRSCKACGRAYHVTFVPPAKEGVCDACGGELSQRSDDTESVVKDRLAVYHEQTAPLVDYYRERGLLTTVDGDQSVDAVTSAVLDALSAADVTGGE